MNRDTTIWNILAGIGAGAAAMYFLDPDRGARRRAIFSDKVTSAAHDLPDAIDTTRRDLSNRAYGYWKEATKMFSNDNPSDQVLEARVRSKLGRVVSHPSAVHVASTGGNVALDGVILSEEVPALLSCVEGVRGVKNIENNLKIYDSREGISALQGGEPRESQYEFLQENWSPAARFVAGTAGSAALAYGFSRGDALGIGLGAIGAAVLARSVSNIEMKRLFGTGGGRRAVTVQKAITVNTSPEALFNLWLNFENFPKFMTNVLEVSNTGEGLSHWKVEGPAGVPVEWDAEITRIVENELIAWKTVEGSTYANAGYVLFEPVEDGKTEVTVRISYNPPAGAIGHAVATIFGSDPKSQMDADLMRMKSMIETGEVPSDAAQKTGNLKSRTATG